MFKRIDHIELLTAVPERAIAFYVDVLDFRERERARIPTLLSVHLISYTLSLAARPLR